MCLRGLVACACFIRAFYTAGSNQHVGALFLKRTPLEDVLLFTVHLQDSDATYNNPATEDMVGFPVAPVPSSRE